MLYPRGYTAAGSIPYNPWLHCQWLPGLKGLMMSQGEISIVLFCLLFLETTLNFQEPATVYLCTIAMLLLNTWSPVVLWKITLKKTPKKTTLNVYISKTTANWESKLRLCESSLNFPQNSILFSTVYPHWYTAESFINYNPKLHYQQLTGLEGLMMS